MSHRRERKVIYPSYFDSRLSRKDGRRVPRSLAIRGPTLQDLVNALKSLSIRFYVEKDKGRPSRWYKFEGRVLVHYEGKKEELLKTLAREMVRQRREVSGGSSQSN
ncbi:MAG: signal recognition particle protein Srp19 [Candidatus Korarchaeum sp.]|jgi:signal recognition particle subunit SRP19|nr:signal recognition particle protein Srp19 [Candidatus Korarchaeum sp.]